MMRNIEKNENVHEYKMSTDRESGRGNKRARVTTGSRNPKHSKIRKALHCAQS
jgi:hypothetical protein